MYNAAQVKGMIDSWKKAGIKKADLVIKIAEACMGWSYVWGALGEEDTVEKREYYMNRSAIGEGDRELIKKRCQVLNGSKPSCEGCKYFPKKMRTRIFDCRGFTRWVLQQAGCGTLQGAGATSQYNTASNWSKRGEIKDMPLNQVCCVFKKRGDKMEHTGLHVGGGRIIHCSVEVKESSTTDKSWGWTHYAIPKDIGGDAPVPIDRPTLRKGDSGSYVTELQNILLSQGYDLYPYGADGKFGRKTETAVKAFQANHNLTADGIVGQNTWRELLKTEEKPVATKLYTITIPHLSKADADRLKEQYSGATVKAE
jgi:cell wall-associated NlpC family hydrolase